MAHVRHPIRRVALLIEWSRIYGRNILRGIGKYVQAHGRWKVYHTERKLAETAPSWLRTWQGDGIIARVENFRLADQIKQLGVPLVDLFDRKEMESMPGVLSDNGMVGRMAADHLMERGLEQFAYCGLPDINSSEERCVAFVDHLTAKGYQVSVYDPPRRRSRAFIAQSEDYELRYEDSMARWLETLPKPVGLMACNDCLAHQVLMACADSRVAVPEEVAVIGVDNDELICGLSRPSISSVELAPEEVGYEAAALLDELMDGQPPPERKKVVKPRGVVARQSTDIVAVADPELASTLHFIREHACDGIDVGDLLTHIPLSRRTLERRFLTVLGRSPRDEIARVQLGHVMRLLSMTDYPLAKIAQLTGFRYLESMCALFKKTTGQTPGQYRRQNRSGLR